MNIANKLTLSRIAMVPFFMYFLLGNAPFLKTIFLGNISYGKTIAFIIFIVASLTDWADGYLARKHNLITKFGQFMDPLADKLLITAALIAFVETGDLPSWVVVLIIAREFIVSIFRAVAASEGIVIAASKWGKFKTVSQMIMTLLILMGNYPFEMLNIPMDQIFVWIAVALTLISGFDYLYKNKSVLSENTTGKAE